jgi:hypothetical protein
VKSNVTRTERRDLDVTGGRDVGIAAAKQGGLKVTCRESGKIDVARAEDSQFQFADRALPVHGSAAEQFDFKGFLGEVLQD